MLMMQPLRHSSMPGRAALLGAIALTDRKRVESLAAGRAVLDYSGAVEQHVDPADLRKEGGDGGGIEDVELTAVQLRGRLQPRLARLR